MYPWSTFCRIIIPLQTLQCSLGARAWSLLPRRPVAPSTLAQPRQTFAGSCLAHWLHCRLVTSWLPDPDPVCVAVLLPVYELFEKAPSVHPPVLLIHLSDSCTFDSCYQPKTRSPPNYFTPSGQCISIGSSYGLDLSSR